MGEGISVWKSILALPSPLIEPSSLAEQEPRRRTRTKNIAPDAHRRGEHNEQFAFDGILLAP